MSEDRRDDADKTEIVQHKLKAISNKLILKTPKGTRDFNAVEMIIRRKVFNQITDVFIMHGAVEIETPVFELREVLTGKYGEDSKLIYDLQDQGGEILSMRYDLTVPFARYVAMNKLANIKRYHIARVYRRDQPSIARGRYREFYQCDFDIAGTYSSMIPDTECVQVVDQLLTKLNIGKYIIRVNHRKVLDGIFSVCGVPPDKFRQICSAIDKLDKMEWAEVKKEMVEQKDLSSDVADKIGQYVKLTGGIEMLSKLQDDPEMISCQVGQEGLKELQLLHEYCCASSCGGNMIFDMGVARGLDYYTGVIFEVVLMEDNKMIGSIAGGGRYDELVGMFNSKGQSVPCVGVSFGIERMFAIQERKEKNQKEKLRSTHTQVLVCSACKNFLHQRLRLVSVLHQHGIYAETIGKLNPKLLGQFNYADDNRIPLVLLTGIDEESQNIVKMRTMSDRKEIILPADDFIDTILSKLKELNLS